MTHAMSKKTYFMNNREKDALLQKSFDEKGHNFVNVVEHI